MITRTVPTNRARRWSPRRRGRRWGRWVRRTALASRCTHRPRERPRCAGGGRPPPVGRRPASRASHGELQQRRTRRERQRRWVTPPARSTPNTRRPTPTKTAPVPVRTHQCPRVKVWCTDRPARPPTDERQPAQKAPAEQHAAAVDGVGALRVWQNLRVAAAADGEATSPADSWPSIADVTRQDTT